MGDLISQEKCMGCLACYNICPVNAIKIVTDEQGFVYPYVDPGICKKCHLCEKVCPPLNGYDHRYSPQTVYASWRKNDAERISSNSGGVAASLSEFALTQGYAVVGAIIDDDLVVKHSICDTQAQLKKLRMSKYVQSSIGDVYRQVKERIIKGQKVLFFGTPCQVDAVKRVLGEKYRESLIGVDLICHGVPSPQYLKEHISSYEPDFKKINTYAFRDNNQYVFQVFLNDGRKIVRQQKNDAYLYAFLKNVLDREACHSCKYSSTNRAADITIGDFWGLESLHTENVKLEKEKGISAVLINTGIGRAFFNSAKADLFIEERELEELVKYNPFLREITESNSDRFIFREKYVQNGFEKAVVWLRKHYFVREKIELLEQKVRRICTRYTK